MAESYAYEYMSFIGKQLKRKRQDMGMRQSDVAARAGISTPALSRLENGDGSSLETFVKVIGVLREDNWLKQLAPAVQVSPAQVWKHSKPIERVRV
jgi:transcriptional regulator with XRE-family HTH domain